MRVRSRVERIGLICGLGFAVGGSLSAPGCASRSRTPVVIFLDGAGHFGYAGPVRRGLRAAGYEGRFEQFVWTSLLGPGVDHLVARSSAKAESLATMIKRIRKADPDGPIHLIGLSSGTAVVVSALERLERSAMVDNVVLLSASISAGRNLSKALGQIRGHLYCTASKDDGILGVLAVNADGGSGPPAGLVGLKMPHGSSQGSRERYARVVNLPWQPAYSGFDWDGGHTSVTSPKFIESVIAPRLRTNERFPTDRPLYRGGE